MWVAPGYYATYTEGQRSLCAGATGGRFASARRSRPSPRGPGAGNVEEVPQRLESDDDAARERLAAIGEIAAEIAHELRNVLQIISANAYLARQELTAEANAARSPGAPRRDPAAVVAIVAKIERNARLAHAIVDDLMMLARGEAARAEPVLLAEIVVASRSQIEPEAAVWLDRFVPVDLRVRAHPGLAARLLHALYDNAIAASSPRAPHVATHAWEDGGRVIVEVQDDGPGVPDGVAERIFEPLVTGRPGGSGFGLALARRIAAAHGGEISLAATSEAGATFRVVFPGPHTGA